MSASQATAFASSDLRCVLLAVIGGGPERVGAMCEARVGLSVRISGYLCVCWTGVVPGPHVGPMRVAVERTGGCYYTQYAKTRYLVSCRAATSELVTHTHLGPLARPIPGPARHPPIYLSHPTAGHCTLRSDARLYGPFVQRAAAAQRRQIGRETRAPARKPERRSRCRSSTVDLSIQLVHTPPSSEKAPRPAAHARTREVCKAAYSRLPRSFAL